MQNENIEIILPDWEARSSVNAFCTTRLGGVSKHGYDSFNLATHVEDDAEDVATNRLHLSQVLNLPAEPQWLDQTHSVNVAELDETGDRQADAAITRSPGNVAVVLTADCLPVLFCNRQGTEVAAAHAGWRGLLNGVLEQTASQMKSDAKDILAWMGPAIGPLKFEVGEEVRQAFVLHDQQNENFFQQNRPGHFLADLYSIARLRLKNLGLQHISGGDFCTFTDHRFFSYRREKMTGRQACLIYINK
ncbi:MAG: peptidoglycan editing factor PgeF [Gammaproteobacteria bacterium]|nr:peptidoglycan editing factor PgeF [Gammaproteobacteria bacterium]